MLKNINIHNRLTLIFIYFILWKSIYLCFWTSINKNRYTMDQFTIRVEKS